MSSVDDNPQSVRDQMIENQSAIDALNIQLERKTDEVRIIQQISSEINSTLELDRILEIILDAMDSVLGFEHSMILLAGSSDESLRVAASRGYETSGVGAELPVGQGVFGVVARRKRIMRMGNVRSQQSYLANVRARIEKAGGHDLEEIAALPGLAGAQSQIGIPLVIKERLVGVFAIESEKANAFDALDEMLLTIVANQVANAIDNARMHQAELARSLELDNANSELQQLNATLEASVDERTAALSQALDQVNQEKERSENLLRRMAPPDVIPLMLDDRLLAQRLNVTVLFTDLEGFTAYSRGMEPDEIFSQLNDFFSRAGDVIDRYRGYINKTNGDGIMALFGVPFESATHRTDATLAALAMQQELQAQFSFNIRIGLNSGPVTAGLLGPDNKSLYDVLGDTVNVASRMEAICPVGGVAVPSSSRDALDPWFDFSPLGARDIKGVGNVECFGVLGLRKFTDDARRIDPTSRFAECYLSVADEVTSFKAEKLSMVDFVSLQARDVALLHNEAVAIYALALSRELSAGGNAPAGGIDEEALLFAALLHDVGKHALDPALLNEPSLDNDRRDGLRRELLSSTLDTLNQLGQSATGAVIEELYRFEKTRGAGDAFSTEVEILAAADIYDALTAPKNYKGTPWRIVGALSELLRLPYCETEDRPVFGSFVELMKPAGESISGRARAAVTIR